MSVKDKLKRRMVNKAKENSEEAHPQNTNFEDKVFPDVWSPAGFLVLSWAMFLDFLGLIGLIPVLGQIISIIPDVLGVLTLGVYEWRHGGTLPLSQKLTRFLTKKSGARFLFELLPFVGILPLWTIYVYKKSRRFPHQEVEINEELEETYA